jgi:branched-chain amino acid transport system permease protein
MAPPPSAGAAADAAFRVERSTRASRIFMASGIVALIVLATLPYWAGSGTTRLVAEMAYYLALAQFWNLLAGYAGLVSVGQQAFVGLGGYALFVLCSAYGFHPYAGIAAAGVFAALMALPIAFFVFRLRGAHFAVGTWVVAEACQLTISQFKSVGAGSGYSLTPAIVRMVAPDRAGRDMIFYWLSLAIAIAALALVYGLLRSRVGLALTAIRDSEPASRSIGVDSFRAKLMTFVVVAFCTGLTGGLIFLQKLRISPQAGFSLQDWTVVVIFMVVIGGIGTIEGPIIGLLIYFVLRELLADYGTWYLIVMGLVAVLFMLYARDGIWGWVNSRFRLQLFPVGRRFVRTTERDSGPPRD